MSSPREHIVTVMPPPVAAEYHSWNVLEGVKWRF
jgi:hypothetical protein